MSTQNLIIYKFTTLYRILEELSLDLNFKISFADSEKSLKDKGLYFVGIDIIGDFITEINVTSPTGIREIRSYETIAVEEIFWDFIENKLNI